MILPSFEPQLYAAIAQSCIDLKCTPVIINGTANHVHVLARLHSMVSVAQLAKQMKGDSSHMVTHRIENADFFKWQGSYGAFSIGRDGVTTVTEYIANQKVHHANGSTISVFEQSSED